ncbi:MAG: hypothetical protein J5I93_07700 [Pirellulaceae bacterium]|nr:hypothetical protein [Pirellulaceae bacterium]
MRPTGIAWLIGTALVAVLLWDLWRPAEAGGQESRLPLTAPADDPQFEKLAARYELILRRNPRPGTTFDLWYRLYLDAGRLDQLTRHAASLVEAAPEDGNVWLIQGLVAERTGDHALAVSAYQKAESLLADKPGPSQLLGEAAARQGDLETAIAAMGRAMRRNPAPSELLPIGKQLGRWQLRMNQGAAAVETWNQLAERFADDRGVLEELAELLADEQQWPAALARWQQVARLAAADPPARLRAELAMADIHVRQEQVSAALNLLQAALDRVDPDSWQAEEIRRRLQETYQQADDLPGWLAFWQQRRQQRPDDLASRLELARVLGQLDRMDQSADELREAIRLAPTRRDVRLALIQQLSDRGLGDEALEQATQLTERFPQDVEAWAIRAELEWRQRAAATEALRSWQRMAGLRSDDPALALRAAESCRRAAQRTRNGRLASAGAESPPDDAGAAAQSNSAVRQLLEAAERYYREAVRRSAGDPRYIEDLGAFLLAEGRTREALDAWAQLLPAQPQAEDWRRLSEVLARQGRVVESAEAAARSLEQAEPSFPDVAHYVRLLLDARQFDRLPAALSLLVESARDAKQQEQALRLQVEAYSASGAVDRQLQQLGERVAQAPDALHERRLLAALFGQRGRWSDAARVLQPAVDQAAAAAPADGDLRLLEQYAEALERDGRLELAAEQYRRLMERDARQRTTYGQALVQLELRRGQSQAARQLAEQLVQGSPANQELWSLLAELADSAGDAPAAIDALRQLVRLDPRGVQPRQRLARALAAADRQAEADEHLWRCFELAETLDAKQSVVSMMLDLAGSDQHRAAILQQLQSDRFRGDDPRLARLCMVAVLRRGGEPRQVEQAARLLREMLNQRPDDLDVLRELAELSRDGRQFDAAAGYQRRLAELAGGTETLEKLASDYLHAGERERAVEVWRQLLHQSSDDESLLRVIDGQLAAGAWDDALALADWGCEQRPASWPLVFRSAYGNYALLRLDDAAARFSQLLSLPLPAGYRSELTSPGLAPPPANASKLAAAPLSTTALVWKDAECGELRELQQAALAHARFTALRQDTRLAVSLTNPSALATARVESMVGRALVAQQQAGVARWQQQLLDRSIDDPEALRELILVLAAADQLWSGWEHVRRYASQRPDDALPHLLRLSMEVSSIETNWKSIAFRRREFSEEILASYDWLRQHRASLAAQCREHVGQQLLALADSTAAANLLETELAGAERLSDVGQLGGLACQLGEAAPRQRLLNRALAARADAADSQNAADLDWLITLALCSHDAVPLEASELDGVLQLFDRLLTIDDAQRQAGVQLLAGDSRRMRQLRRIARGRSASESQPPVAIGTRRAMLFSSGGVQPAAWPLPGPPVVGYFGRAFPAVTARFDARLAEMIWKLREVLAGQRQRARLGTWLSAGQQSAQPAVSTRYRLAQACLEWWDGDRDAATRHLEALCERFPEDNELLLLLANARYERQEFRQSLDALQAIGSAEPGIAGAAEEIRRAIRGRWSADALLHVLTGHAGVVRSIAFEPQGNLLASGGVDRGLGLWDTRQGVRTRWLEGHQDIVLCVAFSPSGDLLASAGYDRVVRLWDVRHGQAAGELAGSEQPVRCLAFAPDGKTLAAASDDGTIRLWDMTQRQLLAALREHRQSVLALAFSRDGRQLAAGDADAQVLLWDVAARSVAHRLTGHQDRVSAVAFAPGDDQLYSAGWDGRVTAWDRRTGKRLGGRDDLRDEIRCLAVSPDGQLLAWGGGDRALQVMRLSDWQVVRQLRGHAGAVQTVAFSTDGQLLAAAGYDGNISIWRLGPASERSD